MTRCVKNLKYPHSLSGLCFLRREPIVDEHLVTGIYLAWVVVLYMHYSVSVINEICGFLKINAFTIKPVKQG